jgi:hypothetical protein
MGQPQAKGKGSTGTKKKLKIAPQLVEWSVHHKEVEESSMGTTTFKDFPEKFHGSFTETEKKTAMWVIGLFGSTVNLRKTYHVKLKTSSGGETIFVFTAVKNGNTQELDVFKVGTPTATLPDDTTANTIKARLQQRNISLKGSWPSKQRKAALAGLNDLLDAELDKLKDLKIERAGGAPGGAGDAATVGAHYVQADHTIEVFDSAFELGVSGGSAIPNGTLMALGTSPGNVLPGVAHAMMHEAAHVLAYGEIRAAELDINKAFEKLKQESQNMQKWSPAHYTDNLDEENRTFSYNTTSEPASEPDKTNFRKDLKALEKAYDEFDKALKAFDAIKQTKVMKAFETDVSKEVPITPYSLDEQKQAGSDEDAKRGALEEFFAEGFAVFHWDPDWLKTHRKPVHDYFNAQKHL